MNGRDKICVFLCCPTRPEDSKAGITFHRFPKSTPLMLRWMGVVRHARNDKRWRPHKDDRVCSLHFREEDMYLDEKGRKVIRDNVLPKPYKVAQKKQESASGQAESSEESSTDDSEDEDNDKYHYMSQWKRVRVDMTPELYKEMVGFFRNRPSN